MLSWWWVSKGVHRLRAQLSFLFRLVIFFLGFFCGRSALKLMPHVVGCETKYELNCAEIVTFSQDFRKYQDCGFSSAIFFNNLIGAD